MKSAPPRRSLRDIELQVREALRAPLPFQRAEGERFVFRLGRLARALQAGASLAPDELELAVTLVRRAHLEEMLRMEKRTRKTALARAVLAYLSFGGSQKGAILAAIPKDSAHPERLLRRVQKQIERLRAEQGDKPRRRIVAKNRRRTAS